MQKNIEKERWLEESCPCIFSKKVCPTLRAIYTLSFNKGGLSGEQ